MSKEKRVGGLGDLNHGELNKLFTEELNKVLENIADEKTDWKLIRTISVVVRIKPVSERRDKAISSVKIDSKLAPRAPEEEEMAILASGTSVYMLKMAEGVQMELAEIMEADKKAQNE